MVIASLLHLRRALPALTLPLEPEEGLPPWFVAGDRYPSPSKVREGGGGAGPPACLSACLPICLPGCLLARSHRSPGACPRFPGSHVALNPVLSSNGAAGELLGLLVLQTGALSVLEETELKGGKFGVIRSLLRALDGGAAAKAALDAVVDACAAMQVGGWASRTGYLGRRQPACLPGRRPPACCCT